MRVIASVRHRKHCFPFTCLSLLCFIYYFSLFHYILDNDDDDVPFRTDHVKGFFLSFLLFLWRSTFGRSIGRGAMFSASPIVDRGHACCCILFWSRNHCQSSLMRSSGHSFNEHGSLVRLLLHPILDRGPIERDAGYACCCILFLTAVHVRRIYSIS